jgi:hypothetical protein
VSAEENVADDIVTAEALLGLHRHEWRFGVKGMVVAYPIVDVTDPQTTDCSYCSEVFRATMAELRNQTCPETVTQLCAARELRRA